MQTNKKKSKNIIGIIQSFLILILVVLIIFMMIQISRLQGTARVINYAGLVRGATQREVKLEITGNQNEELIKYLDDILLGLRYQDGHYDLVKLNDEEYQEKLQIQLFSYSNCMENVLDFSRYGMYVESLKDKMGFEFMVRYFESHKDTWDSKTNLIMIDTIIQTSSHIFGDKQHRRNLVTAIRWLKECLRKPIWISDDYKGSVFEMDLPDSESLRCKMQRRVKELKKWEKCLRFKR